MKILAYRHDSDFNFERILQALAKTKYPTLFSGPVKVKFKPVDWKTKHWIKGEEKRAGGYKPPYSLY